MVKEFCKGQGPLVRDRVQGPFHDPWSASFLDNTHLNETAVSINLPTEVFGVKGLKLNGS